MDTETAQVPLERAGTATGVVVVVDVLRAFTTVAHAIDRGAVAIHLVGEVEEALALRRAGVVDLAMGEVGGHPVDGFDLSNSPAEVAAADLAGARIAMRTTSGTQGAVRATGAERLLTGAFVNAAATAAALAEAGRVTFVITAGDEDAAYADYVSALLRGEHPDPRPYLARVPASPHGRRFGDDLPAADLELACQLDRFDRALTIDRDGDALIIHPPTPT